MSDYKTQVIQFLKEKVNGDLTSPIVWLGFEQCFIEAIRGSNTHNLEEQLIFGTDCFTKEYIDRDGNQIIEMHYCKTDNVDEIPDHYKIITTFYKNPETKGDECIFDQNKIIIGSKLGATFGESGSKFYPNENALYLLNNGFFKFDNENNSLKSYPINVSFVIQKDELIYIQPDFKELLVAIKYSLVKYTQDNKKITYIYIDNKLKGE